jgi:hypothetical protein
VISILFHHYKELKQCLSEVEQIEGREELTSIKSSLPAKEEKMDQELSAKEIWLID